MLNNQLPLVPTNILKAHKVNEANDSRFKAVARLLQALWREEKGLPIGVYRNSKGRRRKLGSRLDDKSARQGYNFLSSDIAKLVFRESVYREIGAMMEQERLWSNLLSSQPLCFNLFGGLKLDIDKATRFFQRLFPDEIKSVDGIYFEHSPGRGDPAFTDDNTAFDVFVVCKTLDSRRGFIAIEVKYSETMTEPLTILRPRYQEISNRIGVYVSPDSINLRGSPLQQLWRGHMLSYSMVENGLYSIGRFIMIYPRLNNHCAAAVKAYQKHLISEDPQISRFQAVTLEDSVETFRSIEDHETAEALYKRYLDFERVEREIFSGKWLN
jgi:hypothetical protein